MRSRLATLLLVGVALTGCGGDPQPSPPPLAETRALELPGSEVFPEGVAVDKRTGDVFTGSTTDGAIYRSAGGRTPFERFLAPGTDGRTAATGLKVDPRGRLFVAGRTTGRLFVYDLADRRLLRRLEIPGGGRTLLNDLTFTGQAAYVTDSYADVLYRVALDGDRIGELEPWLPLEGTPIPTGSDFGLNGISASDDGRWLLTVHFDTGRLFRIDAVTREVREVGLGGERLRTGDGLLLDGRTLLAVREQPGDVVPVRLDAALLRGELDTPLGQGRFDFPTTLAERDGTLYVVNSQLDRAPDRGTPPFTVTALRLPPGTLRSTEPNSEPSGS